MKPTIHSQDYSTQPTLYLAFELSDQDWKLGFTIGLGQPPRQRKIAAGDTTALKQEIALAKQRFGLPADAPVVSCYEAGRDGFWLHRFLESEHITNLVVDSASIEVSRRGKHAKTDRLDVEKLLTMLLRYHGGESRVWSVVQVPSLAAEDQRHLHRQLLALKGERTRYVNRIKGLLVGQGIHLSVDDEFLTHLPELRLWDGAPLPAGLTARLHREFTCWQFVHAADPGPGSGTPHRDPRVTRTLHGPGAPTAATQGHRREFRLALRHGVLRLARLSQPA